MGVLTQEGSFPLDGGWHPARGGYVLGIGKITSRLIEPEDFAGTSTLLNLRATERVEFIGRKKDRVVTPPTSHGDIVTAVMRRTHPELLYPETHLIHPDVAELYEEFEAKEYLKDKSIKRKLEEVVGKEQQTDLIRGLIAFGEAAQEHNGGVYADTLIRPATMLGAWLISMEREAELPTGGL